MALLLAAVMIMGVLPTEAFAASKPKKIKLNATDVEVVGYFQIKATVNPTGASQKVTYSTSNRKVATVSSNGIILPRGYGKCTITVASKDNSKIKATIRVSVPKEKVYYSEKKHSSWPLFTRDQFFVGIDGVTGRIRSLKVEQTGTQFSFISYMETKPIRWFIKNKTQYFWDFTCEYDVRGGAGIGQLNGNFSVGHYYINYRAYNSGKVVKLSGGRA